mgnify:CR=1 FL=1
MRIEPGPVAEGFISTVEGVLTRIEEATEALLTTLQGEKLGKCETSLLKLRRAKQGLYGLTLVVKDPKDGSALVGSDEHKVSKRRQSKKEIEALKTV